MANLAVTYTYYQGKISNTVHTQEIASTYYEL